MRFMTFPRGTVYHPVFLAVVGTKAHKMVKHTIIEMRLVQRMVSFTNHRQNETLTMAVNS